MKMSMFKELKVFAELGIALLRLGEAVDALNAADEEEVNCRMRFQSEILESNEQWRSAREKVGLVDVQVRRCGAEVNRLLSQSKLGSAIRYLAMCRLFTSGRC